MRTHNQLQFQAMERPKWSRIQLPEVLFPIENIADDLQPEIKVSHPENIVIENITQLDLNAFEPFSQDVGSQSKGLGDAFVAFNKGYYNSAYRITAKRSVETNLVQFNYVFDSEESALVETHMIVAEPGSKLVLFFDYHALQSEAVHHYGHHKVLVKTGASVKIITLQRHNEISNHMGHVVSVVEEGGEVSHFDLHLGAKFKAFSFEGELLGRYSKSSAFSIYLGSDSDQLDLSYTMNHKGALSESQILSKGVLEGQSKKVFRGNLFFETRSEQSVGREAEYVTLLSDHVQSDSIPALMCSEDDVVGEHAASVGRMDPDQLFYLMSRGLSESEARLVLLKASMEEIVEKIGEPFVEGLVREALESRLMQ